MKSIVLPQSRALVRAKITGNGHNHPPYIISRPLPAVIITPRTLPPPGLGQGYGYSLGLGLE